LRERTGLACENACRNCCRTPSHNIEVSILELLPLAEYLLEQGVAEYWIDRLSNASESEFCVLFDENPASQPKGGCRFYELRPLVCRLFGFSAVVRKDGSIAPVLCSILKKSHLGRVSSVMSQTIMKIPIMSDYANRVYCLDPYLSSMRYPINAALKKAIEYAGYRVLMSRDEDSNQVSHIPVPDSGQLLSDLGDVSHSVAEV
jgi:Fe-S-cluster containining protein